MTRPTDTNQHNITNVKNIGEEQQTKTINNKLQNQPTKQANQKTKHDNKMAGKKDPLLGFPDCQRLEFFIAM